MSGRRSAILPFQLSPRLLVHFSEQYCSALKDSLRHNKQFERGDSIGSLCLELEDGYSLEGRKRGRGEVDDP
jgi:hypothetical protein